MGLFVIIPKISFIKRQWNTYFEFAFINGILSELFCLLFFIVTSDFYAFTMFAFEGTILEEGVL